MKRDALENIVRDAMTEVEVALNTDEIWLGVEQKLYANKNTRRWGWFFLTTGLIVAAAFSFWFVNRQINTSQEVPYTQAVSSQKNHESTMSSSSGSVSGHETYSQLVQDKPQKTIQPTTTNTKAIDSKSLVQNQKSSIHNKKSTSPSISGNTVATSPSSHTGQVAMESTKNIIPPSDVPNAIPPLPQGRFASITLALPTLSGYIHNTRHLTIGLGQLDDASTIIRTDLAQKTSMGSAEILSPWNWYADVNLGIDRPFKTLQGSDQNLIDKRYASETVLEGWRTGVTFGLKHNSGWFVDLGLGVSNVNEKFNYTLMETETVKKKGVVEIIYDKNGQKSEMVDEKFVKRTTETTQITYNRHTFFDIPLAVGYELPLNNRWSLSGQLGLNINWLTQSKGYQFSKEGEVVQYNSLNPDQSSFYKNNTGLSWNTSVKLMYQLGERHQMYLSPYSLGNIQSITLPAYPVRQRYWRMGMALGYRMKL